MPGTYTQFVDGERLPFRIAGPDEQNGYRNCIDPECTYAHEDLVEIAGEWYGVCRESWPMVKRILDLLEVPR